MAQCLVENHQDHTSNENSVSTKEFLQFEKTCEGFKDSDEEIKQIFQEIQRLAGHKENNNITGEDLDDVDLILKRAEDIAQETTNLLQSSPVAGVLSNNDNPYDKSEKSSKIPQIKVTKPENLTHQPETEMKKEKSDNQKPTKAHHTPKHSTKESTNDNTRRKAKIRPYSAGVLESKKKEATKLARLSAPKRVTHCQHEGLIEEFNDTNERVKNLELLNVHLNEDNKLLRKRLNEVYEDKNLSALKLNECEKYIGRLAKECEAMSAELKTVSENENKLTAELSKERSERKNFKVIHDKDAAVIQDLQRQCKEMEMILKRKHPDSVSALIVASKSSTVEDNKKKLLEERISRLEQELKDKEDHFQGILLTLQDKFGDMKQKYENHIIDVERQLMEDRKLNAELKNRLNKLNIVDGATQTSPSNLLSIGTQTNVKSAERSSSAVSRLTQNSAILLSKMKEDTYLIATIKGLQTELTAKQRMISKINRETEELRKNLRSLQKEKDVIMNLAPQAKKPTKPSKSTENLLARMNTEMEVELLEIKKQKDVLLHERNSLMESLKRTNEEFIHLKKKRIQDLHTLQLAHEKELMQMNMQLYPLQEEIKLLNRTVEILQDRCRTADEKIMRHQAGMRDVDAGGDNHGSHGNGNRRKLHR